MILARRFNAGISVNDRNLVASATTDVIRRYATMNQILQSLPALKGRAKLIRRSGDARSSEFLLAASAETRRGVPPGVE